MSIERIGLRSDLVTCFSCKRKEIHCRVRDTERSERQGWECEGCGSIRMDQSGDVKRFRDDGLLVPSWEVPQWEGGLLRHVAEGPPDDDGRWIIEICLFTAEGPQGISYQLASMNYFPGPEEPVWVVVWHSAGIALLWYHEIEWIKRMREKK